MSPILFVLYLVGWSNKLEQSREGFLIGNVIVSALLLADNLLEIQGCHWIRCSGEFAVAWWFVELSPTKILRYFGLYINFGEMNLKGVNIFPPKSR